MILTIIPFFINSAISLGKIIPIFSESSFILKKSGTIITVPFLSTRFCFISSIFLSSFLCLCILFDLVKVLSTSSIFLTLPLVFLKRFLCFLAHSSSLALLPIENLDHFLSSGFLNDLFCEKSFEDCLG
ncbi:MAG: hypothetical protein P1U46_00240 [Patescibacteria group bacterium]|nr:hypothetical protein [Patescibacteria group bacterium]